MMLQLKQLSIGHQPNVPLTNAITAGFSAGGLHVILGVNGSGKTTLLRSVLGVQSPLGGSISIQMKDGSTISVGSNEWKNHIAYVPSTPPRQVGLTVREVLALSGSSDEATKRHSRLSEWLDSPLMSLSDGQAQQVMCARAMLQSSGWLALDEPTAFLDVRGQRDLWEMLSEHIRGGGSILMSTHDLRGVCRWIEGASNAFKQSSSLNLLAKDGLQPLDLDLPETSLEAKLM